MHPVGPPSEGALHAPDRGPAVRFTVLGPLEVLRDGVDHAPTTPKILQLLAVLVLHPARLVHIDTVIRELWADTPPRSVRTTLHGYVHHLRRCIDRNELAPEGSAMLVTKPPGYVFRIEPAQVDLFDFDRLRRYGMDLQGRGRHAEAASAYRAALSIWAGAPLANVPCGPVLSAYRTELLEQQRNTLHLRIESEIDSGGHRHLIGELRTLTAAHPLDETLHLQLVRALGRSGRRSEAMRVYLHLRDRLTQELGVEPSDELQRQYRHLLSEGEAHAS